jgi:hypothetical protein
MKKSLFFCALLLSTTASAQPSTSSSTNSGAAAARDPNAMICRSQRETGSMLNRSRVCKTRAQWDAERRDTRTQIERAQSNRAASGN